MASLHMTGEAGSKSLRCFALEVVGDKPGLQ